MLKRGVGGKSSYSPYNTDHRAKKTEGKCRSSRLDILPSRPHVWLKQLSVLQEQPRPDASDSLAVPASGGPMPSSSCPGTPQVQHSRAAGCPTPAKRTSTLSRHSSAASFPMQSWVFSKGLAKGNVSQGPGQEGGESVGIEVEDIPPLLRDVAHFAEAVDKLKDVVLGEEKVENQQALGHECLGEVLRVLRQVIGTYPLLNTVETLTAAGMLISKVKGFQYNKSNEGERKDFEKSIEAIAVAFSCSVSELLMGEVDSSTLLSLLPSEKSRSMENLHGAGLGQRRDTTLRKGDLPHGVVNAEEVDIILQRSEGGVDSALTYAKSVSKYMKDVIGYIEKRIAVEMEFARSLQKLYQSCKPGFEQPHMPFLSIYTMALEQDLEQSTGVLQSTSTLHSQAILQPLMQRKLEHEKKRKEIKEQWQRARRKLAEAETNLRKAKQAYMARCEEYDKARMAASRAEDDGGSSGAKSLDKKRRNEEEARNKAEEAEATYRTCIADATTQHQELEDTKVTVLRQIQELVKQSDCTLRSATVSYCQVMHMQTVALPVHYQSLCESSKLYDLGQQYATYVKDLPVVEEPEVHYEFEPYTASPTQLTPKLFNDALNTEQQNNAEAVPSPQGVGSRDDISSSKGKQRHGDREKMARTLSSGTMSSTEDLDEKDGSIMCFDQSLNGIEPEATVPTGPFRNVGLSRAAQTHRLRKLRTPAKCRECDSYVYFQGAECEEEMLEALDARPSLNQNRAQWEILEGLLKCLETLAIQCGHKKLQGRLQLFGRDFSVAPCSSTEGIPFIIKKCIMEIEKRALKTKGIYRVNGVKTRVEKLCQAFENGKELVELSQASPHDISNVLKLYLRQLPEPIMPFRLYSSLMGLAKESIHGDVSEGGEALSRGPILEDLGPETEPLVLVLVDKLGELVKDLPPANVATLGYIVQHLRRVAEMEQHNKMSPSNLGIVFGPTLMRPRPSGATVSLSSLVDYPHQARIVEAFVVFYDSIFPARCSPSQQASSPQGHSQECAARGVKESTSAAAGPEATVSGNSLSSSLEQSLDSDSELEQVADGSQHTASGEEDQESPTAGGDPLDPCAQEQMLSHVVQDSSGL
ncbi:minor histocompatibility protein HA-1-like [Scleropages formosus]|uniref:Minor histocompatibility protein HA-1-like n=1 Tax=Scleropages formosus TaxID=113540 RepID=A0A0P7X8T9_SCLFO|nr:minor histocompatibility protein HA-1-like [Scleropages formosus]